MLMVVAMSAFSYTPPTHYLPQNDRHLAVLAYEIPPVATLTLSVSNGKAAPGEQACVAVTAKDFLQIMTMQYTMKWDANVLKYKEIRSFGLPGMSLNNFGAHSSEKGLLTFSWYDPALRGITKPDGVKLYEVCFDVIGAAKSKSAFEFTNAPTVIEISNSTGVFLQLKGESGTVEVL